MEQNKKELRDFPFKSFRLLTFISSFNLKRQMNIQLPAIFKFHI